MLINNYITFSTPNDSCHREYFKLEKKKWIVSSKCTKNKLQNHITQQINVKLIIIYNL